MNKQKRQYASRWIEELLSNGRHTFSRQEAQRYLKTSPMATYRALYRLVKEARLAMPKAGFYVIVDPPYRAARIPPPEWFIHSFMEAMGKPYYVGLLSAAQLYGATHHQPMEFQVILPKNVVRPRTVRAGNLRIRFFSKGPFDKSETSQVKTPTGYETVSTPETTAWDLVRFYKSAGGLDNVITVLSELSERLDAGKLLATVKRHGDPILARRLGWLLEKVGAKNLTEGLLKWVGNKDVPFVSLDSAEGIENATISKKWRLLINVELEPEA